MELSPRDWSILQERQRFLDSMSVPIVGDYITLPDGTTRRITHVWPGGYQTTEAGNGGSFYLGDGYVDASGALDPLVSGKVTLVGYRQGRCWFFRNNVPQAHNGVEVYPTFKVWSVSP
jgi:hypothetical protein